MKRRIERADILPLAEFERLRRARRAEVIARKKLRRVDVGPYATFYFENWDTMWWQIHEMLRIEKGGEAQIADELAAYGPLVPNGRELVATLMFGIEDPVRRAAVLARLTGVEDTVTLKIGEDIVRGLPERDVERTKADGKTSSVHFLHFPLGDAQAAALKAGAPLLLGIGHAEYGHLAMVPPAVARELAGDLA